MSKLSNSEYSENQYDFRTVSAAEDTSRSCGLNLPERYGVDRLVLLYQDPFTLFCYWEINPQQLCELASPAEVSKIIEAEKLILRVYPLEGSPFEKDVWGFSASTYINLASGGGAFQAEVGIRIPGLGFVVLASSNRIALPPAGVAAVSEDGESSVCDRLDRFYERAEGSGGTSGADGIDSHSSLDLRRGFSSEALVKKKT